MNSKVGEGQELALGSHGLGSQNANGTTSVSLSTE